MKVFIKYGFQILCFMLVFCPQQSHSQNVNASNIDQYTKPAAKQSLNEFIDFLSIPNDANIPEQLEPNIQWVSKAFKDRGFTIERLPTKAIDLVLATYNANKASKTILIYVQVDGQPVDPTKWDQATPFTPTLKEKLADGSFKTIPTNKLKGKIDPEWRIFARSASDAKGPINMFLAAWDAMKAAGETPTYNIKVIMDCEEELGSPNLPEAVKMHRSKLAADWLVILDGPMHASNRPTLVFGARGIATMRITTYGPKEPVHSGHYGNFVPNPALRLSQLLGSMKDMGGRVIIPGYYDNVDYDEDAKKVMGDGQPKKKEIKGVFDKLGIAEYDQVGNSLEEAIMYPSLNIRGMASGWVGSKVRTIIPAYAVANLDLRLVKGSKPERLIGLIEDHIRKQGFHIIDTNEPTDEDRQKYGRLASTAHKIAYGAFRTKMNSEIGNWLTGALQRAHGSEPIKIRSHGGSIPISPFINILDVPAVIVPLVNPDNNQHSPNENVRLFNYFQGVKTCLGILTEPLK
jgi:acetylornithine deacetylase/succinyl-diaminopimelate desuccinylase-like protein